MGVISAMKQEGRIVVELIHYIHREQDLSINLNGHQSKAVISNSVINDVPPIVDGGGVGGKTSTVES